MRFPEPIEQLIQYFRLLPGVGPKTATRYALALLKKNNDELERFGIALANVKKNINLCGSCFNFSMKNPCSICTDPKRDRTTICVIAKPQDLYAIENTGDYNGLYHVLHGTLSPLEGITPELLKINHLMKRMHIEGGVTEVIVALNPDMEGETTAIYLRKLLEPAHIKITRLARGMPTGGDVEYADEMTLMAALAGRREI